jgi:hypothetical protein
LVEGEALLLLGRGLWGARKGFRGYGVAGDPFEDFADDKRRTEVYIFCQRIQVALTGPNALDYSRNTFPILRLHLWEKLLNLSARAVSPFAARTTPAMIDWNCRICTSDPGNAAKVSRALRRQSRASAARPRCATIWARMCRLSTAQPKGPAAP